MASKLNNITIAIILLVVCVSNNAFGQVEHYVNGYGRAILTNNNLGGEILEGDTATQRKGLSGYNLFDLGYNFEKGKEFEANVTLRVRQPWGEFWGEETKFEFRQLQVRGDLNYFSYELGDVDVEMTPYTMYNFDEMFNDFESDIFSQRRDILEYENFVNGNAWRLQGVKLGTAVYMKKVFDDLQIKAFGVRTNISDDFSSPDRVMVGVSTKFLKNEKGFVGLNYSGLMDIPLDDFATNYRNHVMTFNVDYMLLGADSSFKLAVVAESGMSDNDYYRLSDDTTYKANDFFVDAGVRAELKSGLKLKVSYKNVGAKYSSPGAQTRRINVLSNPLLFSQVQDGVVDRGQNLYDRFTQEQIYNRALSPVLNAYVPFYNNVTPYGEATPNRQGLTLDVQTNESKKLEMAVKLRYLTEIAGEGALEKRQFVSAQGGLKVGLGELIKIKKTLDLTLGGRFEKTTRDDAAVDLSSLLLDAGLSYEVSELLDLQLGFKTLNAEGEEVVAVRNDLNIITDYAAWDVDITQNIWSMGLRVNFNETTNFIANYNIINLADNKTGMLSYDMNQLFLNFNIMF